jgi:hypothetical protein
VICSAFSGKYFASIVDRSWSKKTIGEHWSCGWKFLYGCFSMEFPTVCFFESSSRFFEVACTTRLPCNRRLSNSSEFLLRRPIMKWSWWKVVWKKLHSGLTNEMLRCMVTRVSEFFSLLFNLNEAYEKASTEKLCSEGGNNEHWISKYKLRWLYKGRQWKSPSATVFDFFVLVFSSLGHFAFSYLYLAYLHFVIFAFS